VIELRQISKRFGPLCALDDVSLRIAPGEVLGLLGENGAGKSTLMHILFGLLRPTTGTILAGGRPAAIGSPRAAQRLGIGMVHQHFKLVPTLTVAQNLSLFLKGRRAVLRREAEALLERLRWTLPMDACVDRLTVGQQQRVEILKALLGMERFGGGKGMPRTLILDEPTAVLTPQEATELFGAVRALRDAGTGVVFISHKLGEVRTLCDRVAILRRGRLVHEGAATELDAETMAEKMVGAAVALPRLARDKEKARGPAVLEVAGLSAGMLREASLQVRTGEIVGVAGVDGNGQSDLARAILGMIEPRAGEVTTCGRPAGGVRERVERIACIAEDRQREALVLPLSVEDNLLLKAYRRRPFSVMGWLRFGRWRRQARALVSGFDIRCHSPTDTVGRLSGGNQQKVVLARELAALPGAPAKPVVLAINPTRGLDVGATAFVLQKLLDARSAGAGVLLIHSDLDELLAISDHVLVMYGGRLTDSGYPRAGKEEIGRLMLGLGVSTTAAPPKAGGAA
jgi:simple sugar transport system ATP-binding protein